MFWYVSAPISPKEAVPWPGQTQARQHDDIGMNMNEWMNERTDAAAERMHREWAGSARQEVHRWD